VLPSCCCCPCHWLGSRWNTFRSSYRGVRLFSLLLLLVSSSSDSLLLFLHMFLLSFCDCCCNLCQLSLRLAWMLAICSLRPHGSSHLRCSYCRWFLRFLIIFFDFLLHMFLNILEYLLSAWIMTLLALITHSLLIFMLSLSIPSNVLLLFFFSFDYIFLILLIINIIITFTIRVIYIILSIINLLFNLLQRFLLLLLLSLSISAVTISLLWCSHFMISFSNNSGCFCFDYFMLLFSIWLVDINLS